MELKKRYRVEVGDIRAVTLALVGCGGTGSFAALHLARLAWAARDRFPIRLLFIDPDHVELKNIGRQNFCPAEIGLPKAVTLAQRYNHAFGLDIVARVAPFETAMLRAHTMYGALPVLVGAVDNPAARRAIAAAATREQAWWVDAGNHYHSGQILIGNSDVEQPVLSPLDYCLSLPFPSVQEPDLLASVAEPVPADGLSCADLVAQDTQSLMINQAMAGWLGVYVYRLLLAHDLDIMATYLDQQGGNARSIPISEGTVQGFDARVLPHTAPPTIAHCPTCGHPLAEGTDELPGIGVEDIIFCTNGRCNWQMLLEDWHIEMELGEGVAQ